MNYISLGKNIKKYRRIADLTQEDLAEICECSPSHIGQVENAHTIPSLEMTVKIANALNVTIDRLINKDYKHPEYIYLKDVSDRIKDYSVAQRILICEQIENLVEAMEQFNKLK